MKQLSRNKFLQTMPEVVLSKLPANLQKNIQTRQPWRWLIQFHFGEPRLHYEIAKIPRRDGWEIGFHWESRDKKLNKYLLIGFRQHLFEIKERLGEEVEAEMWDRGWAKIYQIVPGNEMTTAAQKELGIRISEMITCFHPIFVDLRRQAASIHR